MDKYNSRKIGTKGFAGFTEIVQRIDRKNKKAITPTEAQDIYETMMSKATSKKEIVKIYMRVECGGRYLTFAKPSDIVTDIDEYWQGKVKHTTQFTDFKFIDYIIKKET